MNKQLLTVVLVGLSAAAAVFFGTRFGIDSRAPDPELGVENGRVQRRDVTADVKVSADEVARPQGRGELASDAEPVRTVRFGKEARRAVSYAAKRLGMKPAKLQERIASGARISDLLECLNETRTARLATWTKREEVKQRIHQRRFREGPYETAPFQKVRTASNQARPRFPGQHVVTGSFGYPDGRKEMRIVRINPGESAEFDEACRQHSDVLAVELAALKAWLVKSR